jgi:hypothetical protein
MSHRKQDPDFFDPFGRDDHKGSEPPPRGNARPSVAELELKQHERRKIVPSLPPPPHKDPKHTAGSITLARQRMMLFQAHACLY